VVQSGDDTRTLLLIPKRVLASGVTRVLAPGTEEMKCPPISAGNGPGRTDSKMLKSKNSKMVALLVAHSTNFIIPTFIYRVGQNAGHRLMAIIVSNLNLFTIFFHSEMGIKNPTAPGICCYTTL